jgi:LysM repeat protein
MNIPGLQQSQQALKNAEQAWQHGDRSTARKWAEQAVFATRDQPAAWQMLAKVSGPRASVAYLEQALQLAPQDEPIQAALRQARERLQSERTASENQGDRKKNSAVQTPVSSARVTFRVFQGVAALALFFFAAGIIWLTWFDKNSVVESAISHSVGSLLVGKDFLIKAGADLPALAKTAAPVEIGGPVIAATATVQRFPTENAGRISASIDTNIAFLPVVQMAIPPTPTQTPTPTAAPTTPPVETYTVQRGDTLTRIAAKYGVSVQALKDANQRTNPNALKIGQVLVIPRSGSGSAPQNDPAQNPDGGAKTILVDLSEQRVYAYEGEAQVFSFPASTGRGNGTLSGDFQILDKIPNAYSDPWGFWMPNWMGIYWAGPYLENGFHSLPVLADGTELWGDQIGTPVSYGCVVLLPQDMQQLFDWADLGTPVEIRP